jgi:sugar phosphate isomerase/epimerase
MPAREEKLVLCNAPLIGGVLELSPDQMKTIIDATAEAKFGGISLWAFHQIAVVGAGVKPETVRDWIRDRGLTVPIVESLIGWESGDRATIEAQCGPTLDCAVFHGAKDVAGVVLSPEMDFATATRGLSLLGKMAADRGLRVCIEWLPWSALKDIKSAWKLVQAADGENIGLVVDTWHWLRQPGGADIATLRSIPGSRIHCVQLNDTTRTGPGGDMMMESMTNRLLPGDGEVEWKPLLDALDAIKADPIWAPEVFNLELMKEGPVSMAKKIGVATRKVLGL